MAKNNKVKLILFVILLELFVLPKPAKAYLDPGSTSYLFQLLIAGALGALFYIKSIVKWFKNLFRGNPNKKRENSEDEAN